MKIDVFTIWMVVKESKLDQKPKNLNGKERESNVN